MAEPTIDVTPVRTSGTSQDYFQRVVTPTGLSVGWAFTYKGVQDADQAKEVMRVAPHTGWVEIPCDSRLLSSDIDALASVARSSGPRRAILSLDPEIDARRHSGRLEVLQKAGWLLHLDAIERREKPFTEVLGTGVTALSVSRSLLDASGSAMVGTMCRSRLLIRRAARLSQSRGLELIISGVDTPAQLAVARWLAPSALLRGTAVPARRF